MKTKDKPTLIQKGLQGSSLRYQSRAYTNRGQLWSNLRNHMYDELHYQKIEITELNQYGRRESIEFANIPEHFFAIFGAQ